MIESYIHESEVLMEYGTRLLSCLHWWVEAMQYPE